MTQSLITIGMNETMERAYARMQQNRVRHLPVTDDLGSIIGILSDRDVCRAGFFEPEEAVEFDPELRVRDFMSWPVIAMPRSTPIRDVARRMVQEKISALLVTRDEKVEGIVTTDDLLKVLLEVLDEPTQKKDWDLGNLIRINFSAARGI